MKHELLKNIDKIHTTELGILRIKRNLNLICCDVVEYLKNLILNDNCKINKKGKNYYCEINKIRITINSYSFTIITVHKI